VVAGYTAGVLALMLLPLPDIAGPLPSWSDKAVHAFLFASLAALLYWDRVPAGRPRALVIVLPVVLLAGLIELMQAPLPERSGDVWDFAWSVVGAVAGYLGVDWAARRAVRADRSAPPR
jgi:VanZ family protein